MLPFTQIGRHLQHFLICFLGSSEVHKVKISVLGMRLAALFFHYITFILVPLELRDTFPRLLQFLCIGPQHALPVVSLNDIRAAGSYAMKSRGVGRTPRREWSVWALCVRNLWG